MPRKESAHVVTGKMNGDRRKQRQKKKKKKIKGDCLNVVFRA